MAQTDILEYLRKTPHNTNVNVVKTMLNAEGDGGAEPLIVTATKDDNEVWTLDKTYNEIKTAVESGQVCVVKGQITVGNTYIFTTYVSYVYSEESEYFVLVFDLGNQIINLPTSFCADSADGYPIVD